MNTQGSNDDQIINKYILESCGIPCRLLTGKLSTELQSAELHLEIFRAIMRHDSPQQKTKRIE